MLLTLVEERTQAIHSFSSGQSTTQTCGFRASAYVLTTDFQGRFGLLGWEKELRSCCLLIGYL